jgi:uncharacterized protein YraI
MLRTVLCGLALVLLPSAALADRAVVTGVGADDMLKLRAGPGTGYRVVVGLPDGTVVIRRACSRVGGTPWCEVRLAGVRGLTGYVSGHYLRPE